MMTSLDKRTPALVRAAHLAALWSFAVTLPLFDLLGGHPEFFASRGASAGDIVVFALVAALVPPLVLFAAEWAAGAVRPELGWGLHLACVGALAAVIALELLPLDGAGLVALAVAGALGVAAAAAYARAAAVRAAVTILAPLPLVLLGVFLLLSDVSPIVLDRAADANAAGGAPTAPIVMVVFDEFPVHSLMAADGRIDAAHFPNFARLARDSTWYRDTASVDQDTPYAVPAILDARLPRRERLPVAADHPQNLFSLLAGRYELHVREDATAICAPRLCGPAAGGGLGGPLRSLWNDAALVYAHEALPDRVESELPAVTRAWGRFEATADPTAAVVATRRVPRETKPHRFERLHANLARGRLPRFEGFVADIEGGSRPRLHFIHILLPHVPYQFLSSGRRYRRSPLEALTGLDTRPGYGVPFLVHQSYQRHLLQLEATDRLLGELLDRLHELDLYDRAAIAVVADHGISFRLGHDRRLVRAVNVADIAPVPFFLKAPGQRRGHISDKPLRTVDVLPTIADVVGFTIPWHVDGRSARRPTSAAQRNRHIISKRFRHVYPVDSPRYEHEQAEAVERKLKLFGGEPELYGPQRDLVGRRLGGFGKPGPARERAVLADADEFREFDPDSGFVPAHLVGRIEPGRLGGGRVLAVALNGTIAATGRTFTLEGDDDEEFSLLIPERSFRRGRNRIQLLLVGGTAAKPRLRMLR
jgi:hypothetical protein